MLSLTEVKSLVKSGMDVDGQQFTAPTGAVGMVLAGLSPRGKKWAEFTCVHPGCTNTHYREISDWHQCGKCGPHALIRLRDQRRRNKPVDVANIKADLMLKMKAIQDYAAKHSISLTDTSDTDEQ